MKKKDFLLIGAVLFFALAFYLLGRLFSQEGEQITITVDGQLYGTYSLKEDQTIEINGTNVCRIEDGKAKMIQADCPDHLCMHQKAVDENGGTITCLPNKVVITGGQKGSGGTDAVAGVLW